MSKMHAARERLQCKDMDWYLKNVDVELGWEESRICIPGAPKHVGGCEYRQAAPSRSTIDRLMPVADFKKVWQTLDSMVGPNKQQDL